MKFLKYIFSRILPRKKKINERFGKPRKSLEINKDFYSIKNSGVSQICLISQYRLSYQLQPTHKINLNETGFSLFSQHEEDGLLLFIFSLIGVTNKKSIELCSGNGIECNTANLIINHKWIGLLIDAEEENIETAKEFYNTLPTTKIWPPTIVKEWINIDNINSIITSNGFAGEVDLLSLDIDGIDYWLWKAIVCISPRVVILEINHLWGPFKSVSVPYSDDFKAEFTEHGSDYAGASIAAFIKLANQKGYRLVGANSIVTNAIFIRKDIEHDWLLEVQPETLFTHPRAHFGMIVRYEKIKDKEWINI
jgi:hypothetical protein